MMRCGLVAKKIGMTQIFNEDGKLLPVTLLHVPRNVILGVKSIEKHGYNAVIVGYGEAKESKTSKPLLGVTKKISVSPVQGIKEFVVSSDYSPDLGKAISVGHFVMGQYIDVAGKSVGKGFAGAMKRHGFSGLEASHGVSISHRAHGSTGQRQDPGKVFKNKKMAGHMGCRSVTVQNLKIADVDLSLRIIAVLGCVPGKKGRLLVLRDSVKRSVPCGAEMPAAFE